MDSVASQLRDERIHDLHGFFAKHNFLAQNELLDDSGNAKTRLCNSQLGRVVLHALASDLNDRHLKPDKPAPNSPSQRWALAV